MIRCKLIVKVPLEIETGFGPVNVLADGKFRELDFSDEAMVGMAESAYRENLTVISKTKMPDLEIKAEPAQKEEALNLEESTKMQDAANVGSQPAAEPGVDEEVKNASGLNAADVPGGVAPRPPKKNKKVK